VHQHGRVDEALVVDELVAASALQQTINDQCSAESLQVNKIDMLELGSGGAQDFLELVTDPETGLDIFLQPLCHSYNQEC